MKNKILKFLKSPIIVNLVLAAILVFVILIFLSIYLRVYTHHNEKIFTPSFKGMNITEAEKVAKEKHLKIKVIDSLYSETAEPGEVLDQTPKTNFLVKSGRTIFVTIRAYTRKMTKMPNVVYNSLIQARSILETQGLRIGYIEYRKSEFNDVVLEQLYNGKPIKKGTEIPAGSVISLVVGSTQGTMSYVPDLIGLTEKQASYKVAEYSVNLGNISYDDNVITKEDSLNATVYKQSINKGVSVAPGTEVDIWLR